MRRVPTLLLLAAAGAALAVIAAGCGGSKSSSGVASLGPGTVAASTQPANTTLTRQDFQTAVLAYAKCLRSEGFDVPDPNFSQGGGGGGGLFLGSGINRNDPKFQKAQEKCRPILAAVRPQFNPADRQKFQDAALKFAQCMRKNGVDVPDPDFSGSGGPGGGPGRGGLFGGGNIDPSDPKVQAAMQTCRSVFTDAGLGGPGGRGGGFGPPGGAPGP